MQPSLRLLAEYYKLPTQLHNLPCSLPPGAVLEEEIWGASHIALTEWPRRGEEGEGGRPAGHIPSHPISLLHCSKIVRILRPLIHPFAFSHHVSTFYYFSRQTHKFVGLGKASISSNVIHASGPEMTWRNEVVPIVSISKLCPPIPCCFPKRMTKRREREGGRGREGREELFGRRCRMWRVRERERDGEYAN